MMEGQAASTPPADDAPQAKPKARAAGKAAAKSTAAKKQPAKKTAAKPAARRTAAVIEPAEAPEASGQIADAAPAKVRSPARPWTTRRRMAFLEALAELGQVRAAARAAGVSSQQVYRQRQKCPAFAKEWNEAMDRALDALEETLLDRAMNGVEKPVYYGGKSCGSVRQYSDALAMFLLRARRPETYGRAASGEAQAAAGAVADGEDPVALIEARLRALAGEGGGGLIGAEAEKDSDQGGL